MMSLDGKIFMISQIYIRARYDSKKQVRQDWRIPDTKQSLEPGRNTLRKVKMITLTVGGTVL